MINKKIKLKICGMREVENINRVAALQPDYMGFIFYPKSPRFVGEEFKIPKTFPATTKRVGVFVNESTAKIATQVSTFKLDYVQLHGDETVEQCEELKEERIKLIKVFSIDDAFNFKVLNPYNALVNFFLFDTKEKYYGGNAKVFNWEILKDYDQQIPFFLSGGLGLGNVDQVNGLKDMNLHALDVNSGVEVIPGLKDIEKIEKLKKIVNAL